MCYALEVVGSVGASLIMARQLSSVRIMGVRREHKLLYGEYNVHENSALSQM